MKAALVDRFGGVDVIQVDDVPRPVAAAGQVLVRVKAAGVGPWDAWVRAGKSVITQPLPLVLGSDLSGIVEDVAGNATSLQRGDEVYGVTNARFTGACAEYAVAEAGMVARKPRRLSYVEASSVPVVACTAWQMVVDHGAIDAAKRVLVHGAAGNVGAFAVQLARRAGAEVVATAYGRDAGYVRGLGADRVLDVQNTRFEDAVGEVDIVLDTIGGETLSRSFAVVKPGGAIVSSVSEPDPEQAERRGVRGVFFLVEVSTLTLNKIAELLDSAQLVAKVGEVLPLAEVRRAHEMLAGAPHARGKIVLEIERRHRWPAS